MEPREAKALAREVKSMEGLCVSGAGDALRIEAWLPLPFSLRFEGSKSDSGEAGAAAAVGAEVSGGAELTAVLMSSTLAEDSALDSAQ